MRPYHINFDALVALQQRCGTTIKHIAQRLDDGDVEAQIAIAIEGLIEGCKQENLPTPADDEVRQWLNKEPGLMIACIAQFNVQFMALYALNPEHEKKPESEA
jgi:hypothetical protein